MKRIFVICVLSLLAYFLNLIIEIGWHTSVLQDVKFTHTSEWLPWEIITLLPPSALFYASIGWLYQRYYQQAKNIDICALACLVWLWRYFFTVTIWYITPSFLQYMWQLIAEITPSACLLIGYYCRQFLLERRDYP